MNSITGGLKGVYSTASNAVGFANGKVGNIQKVPENKTLKAFPNIIEVKRKTPVQGGGQLRPRWKDKKGRIYEWDFQEGHVEIYSKTGKKHLGAFDPDTGKKLKDGVPARRVSP